MNENELRALVRQAIARVKAGSPHLSQLSHPLHLSHSSHLTLEVSSGADEEGPCIIEPAVPCTHCGYCKSLGH